MVATTRLASKESEPRAIPLVREPSRPLLTDADGVGCLIDLSGRTVRRLDSAAKIPRGVRVGGAKRWRLVEIEAWVAAGCPDRARWEQLQKP